jgi:tetratricopeptide (TPR) repeat protein
MDQSEKWTTYWNSARRAVQQEKLEHAEPLLYAALDIAEDFDISDPRLVMTLECLAEVLFRLGRPAQSEPVVKRVILIYERKYGLEHPDLGVFINNLGLVYHKQKKYFMAETDKTPGQFASEYN